MATDNEADASLAAAVEKVERGYLCKKGQTGVVLIATDK